MRWFYRCALIWVSTAALVLCVAGFPVSASVLPSPWRVSSLSTHPVAGGSAGLLAFGRYDAWDIGYARSGARVLHWTGGLWRALPLPGAASLSPIDVAASSADDIWVGGLATSGTAGATAVTNEILRYDGHRWVSVPAPASNFAFGLAVVSSTNAWGIGGASGCPARCYTGLLHWNGLAWQPGRVWLASVTLGSTPGGQLWAVGQPRLTAAGVPAGPVEAYTWTRGTWRYVRGIPDRDGLCGCGDDFAARNNVWIDNAHWNGRYWRLVRIPQGTPTEGPVVADGRGGAWFGPWAHWTGRTWVTYIFAPLRAGYSPPYLPFMTRIPGTTTILAAGSTTKGAGLYNIIMRAGELP